MRKTAANVEMQGIEFQIVNDSAEASRGLDELAKSLANLKNSLGTGGSAMSRLAKNITNIKTAVSGLNTSKLTDLSVALISLGSAASNLTISSSIGNQIGKISEAISAIPDNAIQKVSDLAYSLSPLTELGKQQIGPFITQLKKIPELVTELETVDMSKFKHQMEDLANAMKPFADEMQKVSSGFSAFPSRIQRLITSTERYNNTVRNATNHTTAWGNALKKISLAAIFRSGYKLLASAINKSSEYTETLNMFTVSMGEYAQQAYEYAQTVSEVLGIDPSTWMENQGVFNSIITGFGVAGDKAAVMSKNLTQLAYDLSSFYNIGIEESMQKVQSGISGELEPLRRLGYDLSVARLQQEALNLGIEKSVSDMTQAEKAQLRYHAMLTQVTQVQGDMARTLQEPANQLRALKAQVEQAARAFGNIFIPILNAVLPVAIAVASAIREIVSAIAALFGIQMADSVDWGDSIGSAAGATGDIADNMDSAAGSAKELKKYLAGFDELNVLPDQSSSSGGSGSSGCGSGFDLDPIDYDFLSGAVTEKVDEIKAKLEPFVNWFKENLDEILDVAKKVAVVFLGWKVAQSFIDAIETIKSLSTMQTISIGVALTLTGFTLEFTGIKDAIQNGLGEVNFGEIVAGGLLGVSGTAILGTAIGEWISKAFSGSTIAGAITAGGGTISTGLLGAAVGGIVAGIPMFVTGVYDAIVNGLNLLNGLLIPLGSTMAGTAIGSLFGPVGAGIGALIGLVAGLITDGLLAMDINWEEIGSGIQETFEKIAASIAPIIEHIGETFTKLWEDHIVPLWEEIKKFGESLWDLLKATGTLILEIWETKIKPVVDLIATFVAPIVVNVVNTIVDAISIVFSFITDAITNILTVLRGVLTFVSGVFTHDWEKAWDGIKTIFGGVFDALGTILTLAMNGVILIINTG